MKKSMKHSMANNKEFKIKSILVSNIYSWKNKGDAAIVISLLEDIKKQFPDSEISLSSHDPKDVKKYGNYPFYNNTEFFIFKKSDKLFLKLIKSIFFLFRIFIFKSFLKIKIDSSFLFSKVLREKINSYKKFDLVIACGGGYLSTKSFGSVITKLIFVYDFYLSKIFNKQYILYHQSVGPFNNYLDWLLLKKPLNGAKIIICREKLTFNRLKKYGLNNLILSSDIAFNLRVKKISCLGRYKFNKKKINVGITVRKWFRGNRQKIYEKEISKFIIKTLNNNPDIYFYFIPQVIYGDNEDDDILISKNIYSLLSKFQKKRVKIINDDFSPKNLKWIISQMDYFVGTRMHSNIFALSSYVKTLAISYEPKTWGIMKMLKLESYVIDINKISSEKLYKMFIKLIKDDLYLKILKKRIPMIRRSSTVNLKTFI
jgi:colanic acid/amylovoran biosynthesis protein